MGTITGTEMLDALKRAGLSFHHGILWNDIIPKLADVEPSAIRSVITKTDDGYRLFKEEEGQMVQIDPKAYTDYTYIGGLLGIGKRYHDARVHLEQIAGQGNHDLLYGEIQIWIKGEEMHRACYYLLATAQSKR